jgi:hypothetical protein
MTANPKVFASTLRHLENIAKGLERCHPDGSCHGWASKILDCVMVLRGRDPVGRANPEVDEVIKPKCES